MPPAPVDTVVFCSILHEVYSYTEPAKFQLESVRDVDRAPRWATLRPGGRIVIRDGVMPPPGTRRIQLARARRAADVRSLRRAVRGPHDRVRELAPDRVEMSRADAMEFLYTYTWGPASFPYEVRELYGILPYDEYVATLVDWVGGRAAARVVEIPPRSSYLQPGYRDNLARQDRADRRARRAVELPDSNCLIVIEKPETSLRQSELRRRRIPRWEPES